MKKLTIFFLAACLAAAVFAVSAFVAGVVFVDSTVAAAGDGTSPASPLKTFASAVQAVKTGGGTIVLCGDTEIPSGGIEVAASTGTITVTSVYDEVDYDADLVMNGRLVLTGVYVFENINIHNNSASAPMEIYARGYTLTIEDTVTCTSAGTGIIYPVIYGGKRMGVQSTNTHVIVRGGTWRSIFGGNYSKAFNANSVIDFTGGTVLFAVVGGNYIDNFTGNTTVNVGGDAVIEFNTDGDIPGGIMGTSMGNGTAYTFTGNASINIGGNAKVYSNVFGSSRRNNMNVSGDITIDIFGNAEIYRHVFGGGYFGNVTTGTGGITVTMRQNAQVLIDTLSPLYVGAGPQQGTVTGNVKTVIRDNVYIEGSVYGAGFNGTVAGNSAVEIYGGRVDVNFNAGTVAGTVSGSKSVTIHGGSIGGTIRDNATVDLAVGATAEVGAHTGSVTTVAPEGYEILIDDSGDTILYSVAPVGAGVEVAVAGTDAFIDGTGNGNVRIITAATVEPGKSVTGYGTYFIPMAVFMGDGEALTRAVRIYTDGALADGESFSADLMNIPAEFAGETVIAIAFCIVGGEEVATSQYTFSVNGLIG
ncbi:MAG: hypothetical protein IJU41_03015 [Clostridia bacterium]|nr:hypothetical protein [Clostridia bacterium]